MMMIASSESFGMQERPVPQSRDFSQNQEEIILFTTTQDNGDHVPLFRSESFIHRTKKFLIGVKLSFNEEEGILSLGGFIHLQDEAVTGTHI